MNYILNTNNPNGTKKQKEDKKTKVKRAVIGMKYN